MATIMIVDDEQETCRSLASMLAVAGHTAFAINSGREAARLLRTVAVDVVLLDDQLPDLDALDVDESTEREQAAASQKVILYAAPGGPTPDRSRSDGGDRLSRPAIPVKDLLAEVEAAVNGGPD